MNERFLELYNQELRHLRDLGQEFSRQHPRVFPHLGNVSQRPDPYVERLLEGFSFLSAQVQLKQEDAFPRFTEHLLGCVCPNWSRPTPSMAIVEFEPDSAKLDLKEGYPSIPRGTCLWSQPIPSVEGLRCGFVTVFDVQVLPIQVKNVEFSPGDLFQGSPKGTQATLVVTLEANEGIDFSQIELSELDFFVAGDDESAMRLYELLLGHALGVRVFQGEEGFSDSVMCSADIIHAKGFAEEESLLPVDSRVFSGHRLLQEYFSFPQKFRYLTLKGKAFKNALAQVAQGRTLSLAIYLSEGGNTLLSSLVSKDTLRLFSTPVVNVFPKRIDRVPVDALKTEYHLVVDRSCPIAYEVYDVKTLEAFDANLAMINAFKPLFAEGGARGWHGASEFFSLRRVRRLINEEKPASVFVSNYGFSEVFVALVDSNNAPMNIKVSQLGGDVLVTNGAFPILCRTEGSSHLTFDGGVPMQSIRFLLPPTKPVPAVPSGETPWRLINLLSLNYSYLSDVQDAEQSVENIKKLLALFARFGNNRYLDHARSISDIRTKQITRRHPSPGPIAYARGIGIDVTLEDEGFSDSSPFLFVQVLRHFFAEFIQMNSFVELRLLTQKRGLVKTWPAVVGNKGVL